MDIAARSQRQTYEAEAPRRSRRSVAPTVGVRRARGALVIGALLVSAGAAWAQVDTAIEAYAERSRMKGMKLLEEGHAPA